MNTFSAVGAGVAYIIACIISGRLLPVFHVATIIAVVVGGLVGTFLGPVILELMSENKEADRPQKGHTINTKLYQPPEIENVNKEQCPNGCGELKSWDGKLRCWKCGWPDK